jgi:hypothetical protein
MALDLRPLTLGELLDRAFTLYRRHFWLFVGLMAIPSVFVLILTVGSELMQLLTRTNAAAFADVGPATLAAGFVAAGLVVFLLIVGYMVTYTVTLGATTLAVSEIYAGRTATIAGSYSRMRGQVGRLMLLILLIGLRLSGIAIGCLMAGGLVGLVAGLLFGTGASATAGGRIGFVLGMMVGGLAVVVFSLRYALSISSLVLEDVTAGQSIRRSVALTHGNLGRTAVLVIFAMIVTYAGLLVVQGPFAFAAAMADQDSSLALWLTLLGALNGAVGGAITGPLMIVALVVLYYDIRIRKEGLDLRMMLASLDQDGAASAPAGI